MNDPRTQIVYDDARHFVLTTREKFDIITSDPIHPVGEGQRHAVLEGVLRTGEAAPESRRRGDAVGAALRERSGRR